MSNEMKTDRRAESNKVASPEQSLKHGLRYIADCLERGEVYTVHNDRFVRGDEAIALLVKFARDLAGDKLQNWSRWVALTQDPAVRAEPVSQKVAPQ